MTILRFGQPLEIMSWGTHVVAVADTAPAIESVLQRNWPLPIWLTVLLAATMTAAVAYLYVTDRGDSSKSLRAIMALSRIALLGLTVWMIAGWNWLRFKSDKPELVIVVDRSASMATRDYESTNSTPPVQSSTPQQTDGPPTRFESALALLKNYSPATWKTLEQRYQVRWMTMAESMQLLDTSAGFMSALQSVPPDALQSRLGESLGSLLIQQLGRPTAAIVLLTDGITTSGPTLAEAAAKARSQTIPIHTVAIGRELAQPDVRLSDLLVDEGVFLGDEVSLQFTLSGTDIDRASIRVRMTDVSTGEELDSTNMVLTRDGSQHQVRLRFVPNRIGEIALSIAASQVPGETNLENNVLERSLTVSDQSIRVLMVYKTPSFEFRFLKNLLERVRQPGNKLVRAFEIDCVLQDADVDFVNQDDSAMRLVPGDRETLSKYDVFVFGDFNPSLISRGIQSSIVEQVSSGGSGMILACSPDYSPSALSGWPLAAIFPVEFAARGTNHESNPEQKRWQPTNIGQSSLPLQLIAGTEENSKLWRSLPGPGWTQDFSAIKPAAQILATLDSAVGNSTDGPGNVKPILISHFVGAGRVVVQATDETYRWSSYGGNDLYHQRYWIQMLRWLSRGRFSQNDKSTIVAEPRRVNLGNPVRIVARLRPQDALAAGDECRVSIERADGVRTELSLPRVVGAANLYQATKHDFVAGNHRVILSHPAVSEPPSTSFSVTAPPGEQANLRADWAGLRATSETSRGRFYLPDQAQQLFDELPRGTAVRMGALPPQPLWNHPLVALTFFVLITLEWILRRKCRML